MRPRVIVVGGGWSGCAAALAARRAGAEVDLFERTDMLLGAGLVGGIMRNNGRFVATEEAIAMGGGDLFKLTDKHSRHSGVSFPGHEHASLYDVHRVEPAVTALLEQLGINVHKESRITAVEKSSSNTIKAVVIEHGPLAAADVFVDATGTAGPMGNCMRYGNGCAMCVQRCPSFGPRVSIAARMGVIEAQATKAQGVFGAMSGSCKIVKESLAPAIVRALNKYGVYTRPLPDSLKNEKKLAIKACQQYALAEYAEQIILLDTGHAKLMTPFLPLSALRSIPGFESARYTDPYSGGRGNSIRFLALAPHDQFLRVDGVENLFCAGEKTGVVVGHTEAIVTGTLAGHNAVRKALSMPLLGLPSSTSIGAFIAYTNEAMKTEAGLQKSYTFAGSVFFEHMKQIGLYTTCVDSIVRRVKKAGLEGIFRKRLA